VSQSIDTTALTPDQRTLVDLVSTPSVSGTERAATEVFVHHALQRSMAAEIDEAGNALAHRGPADAPVHIMLLGHIDTVPGDIPVRIADGVLHGRGSVDAKGPLAAMLCAAARADLPEGVRLTVAGAVGEETAGSPGARFLRTQHRPHACIIGEPSGWDGVTLGYKGRLLATATAELPAAHTAADEPSAGDLACAWWQDVLAHVAGHNQDRSGVFESIQATVQSMSSTTDGMTSRASLTAGFRLPPGVSPDDLARQLRTLAPDRVGVKCSGSELAYVTDRSDPVVRCLSNAIRESGARPRPKRKTGTADLNVVGPVWGCPIAAYGPGDSALDHTPHERLALGEFDRSVGVLCRALTALGSELLQHHTATANLERASVHA